MKKLIRSTIKGDLSEIWVFFKKGSEVPDLGTPRSYFWNELRGFVFGVFFWTKGGGGERGLKMCYFSHYCFMFH